MKAIPLLKSKLVKKVTDPLGAVSALPFGHLNLAWEGFKAKALATDEFWKFEVIWDQRWRDKQKCSGYAILRDGEIIEHWMTDWKIIELQPEIQADISRA